METEKNCQRCGLPCEDMHWTSYNKDGEVIGITCDICHKLDRLDEYKKDGTISTKLMVDASMAKYYHTEVFPKNGYNTLKKEYLEYYLRHRKPLLEIADSVDEISKLVGEFEDKHWLPYLKEYWNNSNDRGHAVELNGVDVLMWGCAGRVLITVKQGNADVTMIFSDYVAKPDDIKKYGDMTQRGGIQGIDATKQQAVDMLKTVNKQKKLKFKVKDSVTMAGL